MNKRHRVEHGATAMARHDVRWHQVRAILAIGPLILYALAFVPLIYLVGPTMVLQVAPPLIAALVAVVGGLFGMRAGVLAALLVFLLHILLLNLAGRAGWDIMTGIQLPGALLVVVVGAVIGRLHDLHETIKQELTERKRAEEELVASKAYAESIVQNFLDTLIVVDAGGKIRTVNPATCLLLGYTKEELIGRPVGIIFTEEAAVVDRVFRFFIEPPDVRVKALRSLDTIRNRELTYKTKDGRLIPMSFNASVLTDEADSVTGVVAGAKDITELKLAEAAIKKEKLFSESIIATIPESLLVVDKDLGIKSANRTFYETFQTRPEQVIGSRLTEILQDKEGKLGTKLTRLFETRDMLENFELHYRSENPGERIFNIMARGMLVEEELIMIQDITERKRAEEELRKKEMQLIHAGRLSSLGEMSTGVAHEINQPLAIISLIAEGRLRDIQKGRFDGSVLPQELEDILKNVRRIDRIITHMRAFARMAGEWESVGPEEVLDNVFILLGEQFRIHGISISREIEADLPAIEVDANQLEQVFVNILTNAWQVLDESAEEAEREGKVFEKRLVCGISRSKEEAGEYVVFEFADNACGIPDELKTRVFDPFFTTKEAGEGTGLGLSIVYGIVTQSLRGKIWVEDNEMGGASFKMALPVGEGRNC